MPEEFTACVPVPLELVLRNLAAELDELLADCVEISDEIKAIRAEMDAQL
jgi:hypothetical protein